MNVQTTHREAPVLDTLNSIPDAGKKLGGICRNSIYNLAAKGKLRIVKIGHRSFITDREIARFLAEITAE